MRIHSALTPSPCATASAVATKAPNSKSCSATKKPSFLDSTYVRTDMMLSPSRKRLLLLAIRHDAQQRRHPRVDVVQHDAVHRHAVQRADGRFDELARRHR